MAKKVAATHEDELVRATREVERLRREKRRLNRQLKKNKADLRFVLKEQKALMQRQVA